MSKAAQPMFKEQAYHQRTLGHGGADPAHAADKPDQVWLARWPASTCAAYLPGNLATDMTERFAAEKLKENMNRILLKRFAEAGDITPAFVFLAAIEADYIDRTARPLRGWRATA